MRTEYGLTAIRAQEEADAARNKANAPLSLSQMLQNAAANGWRPQEHVAVVKKSKPVSDGYAVDLQLKGIKDLCAAWVGPQNEAPLEGDRVIVSVAPYEKAMVACAGQSRYPVFSLKYSY